MSRFEELKEKLAENYGGYTYDHGVKVLGFKNGWDSCASEYEKLIAEKDAKLKIAVEVLNYIFADADVDAHDENQFNKRKARAALKEIKGE